MAQTSFRLAQMDCAADEQLVRMRLDDVEGVEAVAVDLDRRTVTVSHSTHPAAIKSALDTLRLQTTVVSETGLSPSRSPRDRADERRALVLALAINAGLFVAELVAGVAADSLGLVADSLDMLADASVYALSLIAVGRAGQSRRRLAAASGYLQLGLACIGLIEVTRRLLGDEPLPDVRIMIVVSLIALAGNLATLLVLRRARSEEAHFQASWIFTANDIKVNLVVVAAAVVVALTSSAIPDLLAGAIIFLIVANGAFRILRLSRQPTDSPAASGSPKRPS